MILQRDEEGEYGLQIYNHLIFFFLFQYHRLVGISNKMSTHNQRKFSGKLPIYELLGSRRGIVVSSSSSRSSTSSSSSSRSSSRSTSSSSSRY